MIARIWHGYTTTEKADAYENLLKTEVFPSIEAKKVKGYKKITLLQRPFNDEVEFITIMIFDDLNAVKEFAGEDYQNSYVPQRARQILKRHDETAQHYEIINELQYNIV
jgi:hypothetical protein